MEVWRVIIRGKEDDEILVSQQRIVFVQAKNAAVAERKALKYFDSLPEEKRFQDRRCYSAEHYCNVVK